MLTGVLAVALVALVVTPCAPAQSAVPGQIALRPITRADISAYKLPATTSLTGGLTTVGIGQAVHLEAQVGSSVPAADVSSVTWNLTSKPDNSAALLADSPLPADMPAYEPADRTAVRVVGRKLLRADVAGQYQVNATVVLKNGATTQLMLTLTAATYVGSGACSTCHGGGTAKLGKAVSWSKTNHAAIFKEGIDGKNSDHYGSGCIVCHTVGYDTDANAANNGFDDIAKKVGWTFPTATKDGNWAAIPEALKNVSNIQCENCHGPGSRHAASGNKSEISVTYNSGACGACHDAPTHHIKNGEWINSMHAVATREPSGQGREGCVGCHTGVGFMDTAKHAITPDTSYSAIGCQTCHEPHGQTAPNTSAHLVRTSQPVTLMNGTVIRDTGLGTLCMNCHRSRRNAAEYAATTAGSARFGPHYGTQADMLMGANGFTYGKNIPSSAHGFVVENACAGCHMQTVPATDPALGFVGGHTFKISWDGGKNGTARELVGECQKCHGKRLTTFNIPLFDYDEDGVIDGVQTEVQHLLDQLSTLLPPAGRVKQSLTIDATWTQPQLQGAYNWQFVANDGSRGVHNMAYAVGLLKASIKDLGGDQK